MNPPPGTNGFNWEIIGGNGAIVFPNGQEAMPTTTNSITVEEPNPTGTSIPFDIQVGINYPTISGAQVATNNPIVLLYGPALDAFCGVPTITSISPNIWFAGRTYDATTVPVTIVGTGFNPTATQSCPVTTVTGAPVLGLASVKVVDQTHITVTVSPAASAAMQTAPITVGNSSMSGTVLPTPVIQQNGNTVSSPQTPPTAYIGQLIDLTTSPNQQSLPSGLIVKSGQWTLSGTYIKNYTVSADQSTATVDSITDADLTADEVKFYWIQPSQSGNKIPVSFSYCVNITGVQDPYDCSLPATASFDVEGPTATGSSFFSAVPEAGAVNVYMLNSTPELECGNITTIHCIDFNVTATPPSGDTGSFQFVQIWSSSVWKYLSSPPTPNVTNGPGLDNTYPYAVGYPNPSAANDSPGIKLVLSGVIGFGEAADLFKAQMYLMWDPALPSGCTPAYAVRNSLTGFTLYPSTCQDSIPVPLANVNWGMGCDAINTLATQQSNSTTWLSQSCGGPNPAEPSVTSSTTFPTWGTIVKNTQ